MCIYIHIHKIQSYVYIYTYIYICIEIINPIHTTIPLQKRPKGFSALQVMFSWISFNATFPRENTVDEANVWYNRWQAFKAGRMGRSKFSWEQDACLNKKLLGGNWNMAGWNDFPTILGMSSSQLTHIFQRGRYTSQIKSMGTSWFSLPILGTSGSDGAWKEGVWGVPTNSEFNKTRIWWPLTLW